jgi:lactoylglutathione lyase/glyoxylase I family protein
MIQGIAHVCYVVSDLDRAIEFYRDVLGLVEAFDFRNEEGERFGVYLHVGGRNFIELFRGSLAEPAPGQSYAHLCLEVDDLEQTVAALRERGAQVSDPALGGDQSWQAWLSDPDGNRIELHGYTGESRQAPWLR